MLLCDTRAVLRDHCSSIACKRDWQREKLECLSELMLGHIQDWLNRLLPAASAYLPTVLLSACQSVEKAQSLQRDRASGLCVCFWKVGEIFLEVPVTASLLSASKKGSGLPGLSSSFLCQILPLPLAGTTWTPPLILGQQNSALPPHCSEPAVSE